MIHTTQLCGHYNKPLYTRTNLTRSTSSHSSWGLVFGKHRTSGVWMSTVTPSYWYSIPSNWKCFREKTLSQIPYCFLVVSIFCQPTKNSSNRTDFSHEKTQEPHWITIGGGGFKYMLCSPTFTLGVQMFTHLDDHIFWVGEKSTAKQINLIDPPQKRSKLKAPEAARAKEKHSKLATSKRHIFWRKVKNHQADQRKIDPSSRRFRAKPWEFYLRCSGDPKSSKWIKTSHWNMEIKSEGRGAPMGFLRASFFFNSTCFVGDIIYRGFPS